MGFCWILNRKVRHYFKSFPSLDKCLCQQSYANNRNFLFRKKNCETGLIWPALDRKATCLPFFFLRDKFQLQLDINNSQQEFGYKANHFIIEPFVWIVPYITNKHRNAGKESLHKEHHVSITNTATSRLEYIFFIIRNKSAWWPRTAAVLAQNSWFHEAHPWPVTHVQLKLETAEFRG